MSKSLEQKVNEYIAKGGNTCFHCKSDEIEGGSFSTDSGVAVQAVWCNACGEEWEDRYTLTSIACDALESE
jgi:predicted Zn-ribbon and HTH transcriptional regulator